MLELSQLGKPFFTMLLLMVSLKPSAHEYWIEPHDYKIEAGDRLQANLKVGQHFRGDAQLYLPANIHQFQITASDEVNDVKSRTGDLPALDQQIALPGLALISLVSNIFTLEYKEPGLFEKFLAYEGLEPILERHLQRGLPLTGFKEAYQRFAKSLVQVGDQAGEDRLLGLAFEWLLETDPNKTAVVQLQARLYWHGAPLVDAPARLFVRRDGEIKETVLRTDDQGRVNFSARPGSEIMLNAVQMREPSALFSAPEGSAWISYWTTVTFLLPE